MEWGSRSTQGARSESKSQIFREALSAIFCVRVASEVCAAHGANGALGERTERAKSAESAELAEFSESAVERAECAERIKTLNIQGGIIAKIFS